MLMFIYSIIDRPVTVLFAFFHYGRGPGDVLLGAPAADRWRQLMDDSSPANGKSISTINYHYNILHSFFVANPVNIRHNADNECNYGMHSERSQST
jgi:hypothetical protein